MNKILVLIKKIIPQSLFKKMQPIYHLVLNWLAGIWYRFPSEKLIVVGITGTTGKTTTVFMTAELLRSVGFKVGYTSTAMFSDGEKDWLNDKKMTMLGRFLTQKMLRQMVKNKCEVAIVETTSEGIVQNRHRFINYDIVAFTGLYPEHIDSHGSFENYKNVKLKLFSHLENSKVKLRSIFLKFPRYKIQPSIRRSRGTNKSQDTISKIQTNSSESLNNKVGTELKLNNSDFNQSSTPDHMTGQGLKIQNFFKTIIVNLDDEFAEEFLDFEVGRKIGFKKVESQKSKVKSQNLEVIDYRFLEMNKIGTKFIFNDEEIQLKILGKFNALNATVAGCIGKSLKIDDKKIKQGLERVNNLPGRLERINEGQDFIVIVDYAFEPVAVTKLYETIKILQPNKIIHILGSTGGGRDKNRRGKLGRLAGKKADYVIITNEDPYDDDPMDIIKDVSKGAESVGKIKDKNLFLIEDRRQAIKKAISLANKNDLVLITGKGSEQAIAVKDGQLIPWDDRKVVREILKKCLDKYRQNGCNNQLKK
jgi:UDP-N-acetylmuramoyl-L-alanyl-D-glutamate--2,6-diaminopimelate ligase